MLTDQPPHMMSALVKFSALVFGASPPEEALQTFATALDVPTVALSRVHIQHTDTDFLACNAQALDVMPHWEHSANASYQHQIILARSPNYEDVLFIQLREANLTAEQHNTVENCAPFLSTLWAARPAGLVKSLRHGRARSGQSVLHPDNPYGLTPAEIRVCNLISTGCRAAEIAQTLTTSMATVRTHLRNIYSKTGLDGMLGVVHNLQDYQSIKKAAN